MRKYKYRGVVHLIFIICLVIVVFTYGIIRVVVGGVDPMRVFPVLSGSMVGTTLVNIFTFIRERKMTPEQFEQEQKRIRAENDERILQVRSKAAFKSITIVSVIGFLLALVFFIEDMIGICLTCFAFSICMWIVYVAAFVIINKKM